MATSSPGPSVTTTQFNKMRPKKPIDVWSTREKLCLASAVYKIGDQNWVSVSRAIKPNAETNRPQDWFHQKNCVLQYYDMLEQLEQPKRKRGDRAETDTPSLQIMRKMTIERSEQLKKEINEMQEEFKMLKGEAEAIEAGEWDDRLEDEWEKIQEEQRQRELDIKVEVTDTDQSIKDSGDTSMLDDLYDSAQDSSSGNVDVCGVADEDGTTTGTATTTSLDISNKLPASSHLLSSLLQSNMKTTNELQQLKREQEQVTTHPSTSASAPHLSSPHKISLLKSSASQDALQSQAGGSNISMSGSSTMIAGATVTPVSSVTQVASEVTCDGNVDVEEDGLVDVTTDVVEETVIEANTNSNALTGQVSSVICGSTPNDSLCQVVETVAEEVIGVQEEEVVVKVEEEEMEEVVVEEVETKVTTAELDVEGLEDSVKEEVDKDSQDEDELTVLKHLSESITSGTEAELTETSFKNEPLSPTSSVSSRISETGSKRGRRGKAKSIRSRMSSRKSNTRKKSCFCCKQDDERKEDGNSSRFSDPDLSEEDNRDTDDILSGGLGASATGSIMSESFPNSPASLSICSDTEEEKSYKQWKKSIMLVWRAAATHKYANVFLHPVTDDIAPGYKSVVLRPMDLSVIKKNVETGAIRHTTEFQRDLMLMFSNAIMYNSSDHNVYRMATEMYDDVMQHIEIMVQTTDAKSIRQSRRADASDKEEDTKKRRLSVDQTVESGGKTKKRKTRLDETLT